MDNDRSRETGKAERLGGEARVGTAKPTEDSREDAATAFSGGTKPSHFAELGVEERTRIGPYVLGAKLGQGGMGSVFVADQLEPVQRRVAFKVIQLGMDTEALLRRFDTERQILALMDHPNVATMLDAGATPGGRPYFVMEFVDGIEIDKFCKQKRLTINQRIKLFLQVLAGIEHAHQKGILHRDIKPGNIIISQKENRSVAKIIDFGIAKSLTGTITGEGLMTRMLTQHGDVIGTPNYMAPEQAMLGTDSLDVRTDLFSLGAVLYELLVGISPFERHSSNSSSLNDVAKRESRTPVQQLKGTGDFIGCLADERRVSRKTLEKILSGDIAWVVLKALKSERAERYRSVSEFSDDLKRYLDGYPVIAKPQRFWYLAARFAARRKALVAATSVLTIALIGTTIAAVTGFIQAEKAAELANKSAAEANLIAEFQATQLSEIDASAMGMDLRTAMLEKVRAEHEIRGLEAEQTDANIEQLKELIEGASFTDLALEMLDKNIFDRALSAIGEDFNEQPLLQARLLQTIADTVTKLGRLGYATEPQKRAMEIRRHVLGDDHPDTLLSINNMGFLFHHQGKLEEAGLYYREALEGRRRVLGDEHADTFESIANMAALLRYQGELIEAEPYYREALEGRRRTLGDEHQQTLVSINNMGALLIDQGNYAEAEQYYRESLETSRRVLGKQHSDTLISINNLGTLFYYQGKMAEAEPYLAEALAVSRRTLGNEHTDTLISIHNMGRVLRNLGDLEEAETLGREATEVARKTLGDHHANLGVFLTAYGQILFALERFDEAERVLEEAHAILSEPGSGRSIYVERPVRSLIELFDAWHERLPGQGYEHKANEWRTRLAELSGGKEGK